MKYVSICLLVLGLSSFHSAQERPVPMPSVADSPRNIFIVTIDGFRWQELFKGADNDIINNADFTSDAELSNSMYGSGSTEEKRKNLMPFIWNVAAAKGQVYGNRDYGNDVNVSNFYAISYAGYSEMFTGKADVSIFNNDKINNSNRNIFEYLGQKPAYKNRIALFTSWDVFPYILNRERNGLELNSGYENVKGENNDQKTFNTVQSEISENGEHTRRDMLTWIAAKEYLERHQPKVFFLGLGETDEYAHKGNYDMYLQSANNADRIIEELWHWAQTTAGYKNNTTLIITTDHGRGKTATQWTDHGAFVKGSSQTWMILLGKGIRPEGEIRSEGQIYQKQLSQTIANMLGEDFGTQQRIDFAAN